MKSLLALVKSGVAKLTDFNGEPDHVHLVIDFPPDVEISKLVNNLKTVSSRLIRKEFADIVNRIYSKPVFWTGAYFVASCGGVTIDQVRKYVENQSEILVPRRCANAD
jgi:putative transposase